MSSTPIIQFESLSKTYAKGKQEVQAVKNINLAIESGQVYGFLGPNGAGKTTTIRMMLDLILPTQGKVYLFGKEVRKNREILLNVGSLVEGASFYPYLNPRQNLKILAQTSGQNNQSRIDEILELVDLTHAADRPAGKFSMGMKQRLGLAAALLDDPDILILDEPTNGLDPSGIQEMRQFIRRLVEENGKTVFLSSHLLSEVEQVCDRVAIIYKGEIKQEGRVNELLSNSHTELHFEIEQVQAAQEFLADRVPTSIKDNWLIVQAPPHESPKLLRKFIGANFIVKQAIIHKPSLEEYFISVTQEKAND